ncbi:hypothetical protein H2200_011546 [Cladophialophora chaetospira]|uniref:Cytochrome P450 n=1 Tax=Cladophialophora chaetospira TaxID=386627 RepID=A0AA38WZK0_9EURO|nr:hypothetical protein H2200_011546 [Cladophialophora chaetospira]
MPSNRTILSFLLIPILAITAARIYALAVNYRKARKLGIPIVVVPVSWQDAFWVLAHPHLRRFRKVPGLRNIINFGHHSWAQDDRYRPHQEHGDIFAIVSPGTTEIAVNDPTLAVDVQSHWRTWQKPPPVYEIFDVFGPNVISLNGEDWQRHRRIANPAFREQNNKLVWDESSRQANQMVQVMMDRASGAGRTMLQVRDDCVLIAMHVLSAAGFGHLHEFDGGFREIPKGHNTSLAEALKYLLQNIIFGIILKNIPVLRWVFPRSYQELTAMRNEFTQYMRELIAYNRAITQGGGSSKSADIVSALVEADEAAKRDHKAAAHGSKPNHLTDAELLGDLFIFNLAGFETTANALTYTLPFLATNRSVQDWVGEEIDMVLKGQEPGKSDYEETFPSLVRCLALMYETLRLWGPVSQTNRWCVGEPCSLRIGDKEVEVPPETYVTLNVYAVHSDPRWWGKDNLEWKPQRWITTDPKTGKEMIAPPPTGTTFVPWSAGPRICPGKKFSQVEFVAVISTLLKEYRLEPMALEGKTKEEAGAALIEVLEDSMNVITPKMRRPEDAGVVFVKR